MTIYYDHTFEDYLHDPGIGSGNARRWLTSPQLFKDSLDGICPVKDRAAYQIGRLAHMAILEPARYTKLIASEGPINKLTGKRFGRETKAFSEWQTANPDLIVVDPWLPRMLDRMPPEVRRIFRAPGHAEVSVYQTIAGVQVKARVDWLQRNLITDVKTIDNIDNCEKHIHRYGYFFQAGYYRMIMQAETTHAHNWQFVFCEKEAPWRWKIIELDADWLSYADEKADEVLNAIAIASRTGDYSDRSEVSLMVSRPAWDDDDTEDEES